MDSAGPSDTPASRGLAKPPAEDGVPHPRAPWWMEPRYVRRSLALGIVLGGILVVLAAWIWRGSAESKELTAFLVGIIGIVVGFYFGRQGVDAAQDKATHEAADKSRAAQELANAKAAA